MKIDRSSLLVHAPGDAKICDLQRALEAEGMTLALVGELPDMTVAAWIAEGAPGSRARFIDPVDQLASGFSARFHNGRTVTIKPAPRRSVGPDLFALVFGQKERFAKLLSIDLRAVLRSAIDVKSPAFRYEDPIENDQERKLLEAITSALDI